MWDFRITKEIRTHKYDHYDPKVMYGIRDVFIDENGDIVHFGNIPYVLLENIEDVKVKLQNMLLACDKPVIDYMAGEEEVLEPKKKRLEALQKLSDLDQELGLQ